MSKALVIKGANFAANKVETIAITEPIPCTGIVLSDNTLSFTNIGQTSLLTATLTPADTTEQVYYMTSNPNVATVSDAGLVTCVGIGSATITVTCGNQSAECGVSLSSVVFDFTPYSKLANKSLAYNKDYSTINDRQYAFTIVNPNNSTGGYKAFYGVENTDLFPIPIPNGATQVTGQCSDSGLYMDMHMFDSTQHSEYRPSSTAEYSAIRLTRKAGTGSFAAHDFSEFNVDSFTVYAGRVTGATESDLNATITLTFS